MHFIQVIMITVDINSDNGYKSIQQAADAAQEGETVYIRSGIYHEQAHIRKPLTLIGEDARTTVITGGLCGFMKYRGGKLGTFRSYSCLIFSDNVRMENITVENTAGWGDTVGQAIALYAEGDGLIFKNCRFIGRQDTLFTGPLPYKEIEKGGFAGPTETAPRRSVRQTYENCYIEGDVDFIFGSANANFIRCHIHSLDRGLPVNGYVTAPSTYEGEEGYIFDRCVFTGDCADGSVYLARPWRDHACASFIECELGRHISPALVHDWGKPRTHLTSHFDFIRCHGGAVTTMQERLPCIHIE